MTLDIVLRANKIIQLRTDVERIIGNMWTAWNQNDEGRINSCYEQYQKARVALIKLNIPEDDLKDYDERIKQYLEN